jgi:hypothetical protein
LAGEVPQRGATAADGQDDVDLDGFEEEDDDIYEDPADAAPDPEDRLQPPGRDRLAAGVEYADETEDSK